MPPPSSKEAEAKKKEKAEAKKKAKAEAKKKEKAKAKKKKKQKTPPQYEYFPFIGTCRHLHRHSRLWLSCRKEHHRSRAVRIWLAHCGSLWLAPLYRHSRLHKEE